MNKYQKQILLIGICLIIVAIIFWYSQGAEIFTKTLILIDKTTDVDRLLGIENKQYIDKFIFGLFPSSFSPLIELLSVTTVSTLLIVLTVLILYLLRNKKREWV